jgi:hypothetical protein
MSRCVTGEHKIARFGLIVAGEAGIYQRLVAKFGRHVQFMRSLEDTFQQDEIGDVEVPNGDTVFSCFLYYFNEFLHRLFDNYVQASCHHLAGVVGSGTEWRKMQRLSFW